VLFFVWAVECFAHLQKVMSIHLPIGYPHDLISPYQ
jgi:hypothetical protein